MKRMEKLKRYRLTQTSFIRFPTGKAFTSL